MKRKLFCLLLCVILMGSIPLLSYATDTQIIDMADLLSNQEEQTLEVQAESLKADYGIDAVIVTVDTLNGISAQDYADDYYDENGYADDGLLFLLAMAEREWYISTYGSATYAVTDYGIQQLGDTALPYLSDGDYYEAFTAYLNALPYYFDALEKGRPVDGYANNSGDYYHGEQENVVYYPQTHTFGIRSVFLSLIIGLAAAAVTILIMCSTMNTKRRQRSAGSYLKPGSYQLHTRHDTFLYSHVSKIHRQQNNSSGGSGGSRGGGSSVHRSSSGRSHGGGGGRF